MKTETHWKSIGFKPHHGIVVALSSIHTSASHGIGEFLDLIPLIDFCRQIGFDTIQLLPINDSGYDPSPYNLYSSIHLNPVYISLTPLGIEDLKLKDLTKTQRVEYPAVRERKLAILYDYYTKNITDQTFPNFLQSLCYAQMKQVKEYADKRGCFLQGDIPILISPSSDDVLRNPHLFIQEFVAGAPPDMYNQDGQKWGFPLFNWDAMRSDNFLWWKNRLKAANSIYHMYRIDHVVGLFRIWAIPREKKAIEGFFIPKAWNEWESQGREILGMMLDASPLLPIAEDLGTIPPFVRPILKEYGICRTKVIRWERRWDHPNKEYIPFNEYEPLSLTTVSTHDSETLQQWWRNQPEEAIHFAHLKNWAYDPHLTGEQRLSILHDAHHTPSYFHINLLQEYLAVFPELVSENPDDERINIPGAVLPTNWVYRIKPSVEQLLYHNALSSIMKQLTD